NTTKKPPRKKIRSNATLEALADGLPRLGVIACLGVEGGRLLHGYNQQVSAVLLMVSFFLLHYQLASTTAHTTALLTAMLTNAAS
ncbi:anion permease, partial [Erwinia amylovora]|uniref:anion permease n=1 Tax=Erwinia amylovora TaxID=552 RepID=UPI00200B5AAB